MKRMKRTLALLLCLFIGAAYLPGPSSASAAAADIPKITLSGQIAEPGEEVTVSVGLSENPGIMVMLFKITYDHALLTLTGCKDGGLTGWELSEDRILWLGEADSDFNGKILELNFRVSDTAGPGDIAVSLQCDSGDVGNHDEEVFLPKITAGKIHIHSWGEASYTWAADNGSVTATRTCTLDAAHVETETVDTTAEITTAAACEAMGKTTYTAVFTNPAFSKQTRTVENIPALGHEYELTGWTWTGYTAATATFTCRRNAAHIHTEAGAISSVRTEPTWEKDGSVVYTATVTFRGKTYTDSKTEVLPATGCSITITGTGSGSVSFTVSAPTDASLIVAGYSPEGKMVFCSVRQAESGTVSLPGGAEKIKLFLVEANTFRPLCDAAER